MKAINLMAYGFVLMGMFGVYVLLSSNKTEKSDNQLAVEVVQEKEKANEYQQVIAIKTPSIAYLAGEEIPLSVFDVKERLDRELHVNTYWHSNTIQIIKQSNRYFNLMERILREEGVPTDFKYLAVAESGLTNATSPAGAKGIWQFMKSTAGEYGLEVNSEIDERYDVEKATRAACKYLLKAKNELGSWTNAAAAYNMGTSGFKKIQTEQKETSYFNMNVSEETMRYVLRIVALKEIMENPTQYGFYIQQEDMYQPFDNYYTVEINSAVANWGEFAHKYNTTYRLLKVYNPWIIDNVLTNKNKNTYLVKIPK